MAIDHKRDLPVSDERLNQLTIWYAADDQEAHGGRGFDDLEDKVKREIIQIALAEAQLEESQRISFFLSEAYDIYNARFR